MTGRQKNQICNYAVSQSLLHQQDELSFQTSVKTGSTTRLYYQLLVINMAEPNDYRHGPLNDVVADFS